MDFGASTGIKLLKVLPLGVGRVTAMLNFKVSESWGESKVAGGGRKKIPFSPPPPPSRSFALTPTPRDDIVTLFKLFQR